MPLTALHRLRDRVYSDFLMGSRLGAYGQLLEAALRAGYQIRSVGNAWRLMGDGGLDPTQRHLVLRQSFSGSQERTRDGGNGAVED